MVQKEGVVVAPPAATVRHFYGRVQVPCLVAGVSLILSTLLPGGKSLANEPNEFDYAQITLSTDLIAAVVDIEDDLSMAGLLSGDAGESVGLIPTASHQPAALAVIDAVAESPVQDEEPAEAAEIGAASADEPNVRDSIESAIATQVTAVNTPESVSITLDNSASGQGSIFSDLVAENASDSLAEPVADSEPEVLIAAVTDSTVASPVVTTPIVDEPAVDEPIVTNPIVTNEAVIDEKPVEAVASTPSDVAVVTGTESATDPEPTLALADATQPVAQEDAAEPTSAEDSSASLAIFAKEPISGTLEAEAMVLAAATPSSADNADTVSELSEEPAVAPELQRALPSENAGVLSQVTDVRDDAASESVMVAGNDDAETQPIAQSDVVAVNQNSSATTVVESQPEEETEIQLALAPQLPAASIEASPESMAPAESPTAEAAEQTNAAVADIVALESISDTSAAPSVSEETTADTEQLAMAAPAAAPGSQPAVNEIPLEQAVIPDAEERINEDEIILAWATAWSNNDTETYLSFYAEDFVPANPDQNRSDWEALRRKRLQNQEIRIIVSNAEIHSITEDRVEVRFTQRYTSRSYKDRVIKSIEMVETASGWKFLSEKTLEELPFR